MRQRLCWLLLPVLLVLSTAGCGTFMARRMAQAPKYISHVVRAQGARGVAYSPKFLTNFPKQFVDVGPPTGAAVLSHRRAGGLSPENFLDQLAGTRPETV
jgi:hypothetical protein